MCCLATKIYHYNRLIVISHMVKRLISRHASSVAICETAMIEANRGENCTLKKSIGFSIKNHLEILTAANKR